MKWLLDTLVFLETQIFSQTERGRPFPMNRKIRSFGTPSFVWFALKTAFVNVKPAGNCS